MKLNEPLPLAYETLWFCLGGVLTLVSPTLAAITVAFMVVGGMFGTFAFHRMVKEYESE